MQKEICGERNIFEPNGRVMCAGWARSPVLKYNKEQSKTRLRHAEIDTYFISNNKISLYLSLENKGGRFVIKAAMAELDSGKVMCGDYSKIILIKKISLNASSGAVKYRSKQAELQIENTPDGKILKGEFKDFGGSKLNFYVQIKKFGGDVLNEIAPFERNRKYFYFKSFAPCFSANGTIKIGELEHELSRENSVAYADVIRFSKPRPHNYYRLGCDCMTRDERFSLCLASRVGDNRFGNENCFFLNGGIEKLSRINVKNTGGKLDRPWYFSAGISAVDISFKPLASEGEPMAAYMGKTVVLFGKLYGELKRVNLEKPVVLDNMPAHLVLTEF